MLPIKPNAIADVEPLDGLTEIEPLGLDEEVVVIVHQDIGVDLHLEPSGQFSESPHKVFPINIRAK
jgi:hypothetical protein